MALVPQVVDAVSPSRLWRPEAFLTAVASRRR